VQRFGSLALLVLAIGACGGGGGDPDAAPEPDATIEFGNIEASWTVNGQAGAAGCDTVGGSTVSVDALPTNGAPGIPSVFSCDSGTGTTEALPPGEYRLRFTLYPGNSSLGQLDQIMVTDPIAVADGQVAPGPTVDFTATTTGGFTFEYSGGAIGMSNCGTEKGQAAMTGVRVLLTLDGTCVPAPFDVAAGPTTGTVATSGTVACPDGVEIECVEYDQTFTFLDLAAGEYSLDIIGLEGAEACYPREATPVVYGGDLVNDLGLLVGPLDSTNPNCMAP